MKFIITSFLAYCLLIPDVEADCLSEGRQYEKGDTISFLSPSYTSSPDNGYSPQLLGYSKDGYTIVARCAATVDPKTLSDASID